MYNIWVKVLEHFKICIRSNVLWNLIKIFEIWTNNKIFHVNSWGMVCVYVCLCLFVCVCMCRRRGEGGYLRYWDFNQTFLEFDKKISRILNIFFIKYGRIFIKFLEDFCQNLYILIKLIKFLIENYKYFVQICSRIWKKILEELSHISQISWSSSQRVWSKFCQMFERFWSNSWICHSKSI